MIEGVGENEGVRESGVDEEGESGSSLFLLFLGVKGFLFL